MRSLRTSRLRLRVGAVALSLAAWVLLAGCRQEEVRVYRVPKDKPAQAAVHAHPTESRLTWKTPASWTERPGGNVRLVRFEVPGLDGQKADVAVLPLVGTAVAHGQIVNMVRDQLELEPLAEDELARLAQKVRMGSVEGELVEMTSTNALINGRWPTRVLMAATRHQDTLWLFKMSGPDELVAAQRSSFLEFLESLQFHADADSEASPRPADSEPSPSSSPSPTVAQQQPGAGPARATPALPQWEVPAGWQPQAAGPLLIARYFIAEPEGRAEVTVSAFPGDSGGLLANVNRWRSQVGLEPIQATDADKLVERFDAPSGQVSLVDMTGTDRATGQPSRLIGAILPRGGQTWFFRLRGDGPVVERQRAAFLKFIQSARLPDA